MFVATEKGIVVELPESYILDNSQRIGFVRAWVRTYGPSDPVKLDIPPNRPVIVSKMPESVRKAMKATIPNIYTY